MAKSKKTTKKTAKRKSAVSRQPTAAPVSGVLADLRARLNMADIDDRSAGGPKWQPQRGLTFVMEDALVRTATVSDEEVHIVQYRMRGLDGDNEGKRHVEDVWLNQDWKFSVLKTDVTILGGDWPEEFGDDPLVDLGAAVVSIKGVQGIADVWKKEEHTNIRITDAVESDDAAPDDGPGGDQAGTDEAESESLVADDITAMPEEDDGELVELARENGLDPDEYDWDELKDVLIKTVC